MIKRSTKAMFFALVSTAAVVALFAASRADAFSTRSMGLTSGKDGGHLESGKDGGHLESGKDGGHILSGKDGGHLESGKDGGH